MTVNTISTKIYHGITLGDGTYSTTLTVTGDGVIAPNDYNPTAGVYVGVTSAVANATLINYGAILGSYGSGGAVFSDGFPGGMGVLLNQSGDVLNNHKYAVVSGGEGGSNGTVGSNGGVGVDLSGTLATSTNAGGIYGGDGGVGSFSYNGGNGASGLILDHSTLTNSGKIEGGNGGHPGGNSNGYFAGPVSGNGGMGAEIQTEGSFSNSGQVLGGNGAKGYAGGAGGTGLDLTSADLMTNSGSITGGNGGLGSLSQSGGGTGGSGGVGGTGAELSGTGTVTDTGQITAGNGGAGYNGGAGGIGVVLTGGTATNSSTIKGGTGGAGSGPSAKGFYIIKYHYNPYPQNPTPYYVPGSSPSGVGDGFAGTGGAGVVVKGGTFIDSGAIVGGTGGFSNHTYYGASGGVGALIDGGTLVDSGTISGGNGGEGHATYAPAIYEHAGYTGGSVQFGSHGGTLVLESTGRLLLEGSGTRTGSVGGFAPGATIDFTNMTIGQLQSQLGLVADGNNHVTTPGGNYLIIGDVAGAHFQFTSDSGGGTDLTMVACYLNGTRILTSFGEKSIETLRIGDRLRTLSGALRPIRWIGRRRYSREAACGNGDLLPVRIDAGALGNGLPHRDLWVSPEHAMFVDGVLIPARALLNGMSIRQEPHAGEIVYFHVELDTHDVIFAEGAPSESFVDDETRGMFDNASEFNRLYPHAFSVRARSYAPRVEDGEELETVRRRLSGPTGPWRNASAPQSSAKATLPLAG